jgi:tetratricopeptide (TPR) repeat protein
LPPTRAKLGAETYYSLGNHYLAQRKFEEAYEAYKSGLLLDPNDQDAKHNLELTLRLFYASVQPGQPQLPGGIPAPQAGQPSPDGQPSGNQGQGEDGQPAPGQQPGQPSPAAPNAPQSDQPSTSPPPADAPGSDAQRSLQDALRGLDKEISFEEALRILNLLRDLPPLAWQLTGRLVRAGLLGDGALYHDTMERTTISPPPELHNRLRIMAAEREISISSW